MSKKRIDLTGQRFGRLAAIAYVGRSWLCKCDCGSETVILTSSLRSGRTQSCGCLKREKLREKLTTHGCSGMKAYSSWVDMKDRCLNHHNSDYKNYGGRGIQVCKRWLKFENFLENMGERPKSLTLDRINNDGNYEPGNCRWATQTEQNRNSRHNRWIEYQGETKRLIDWSKELNIGIGALQYRLKRYLPEVALNKQLWK